MSEEKPEAKNLRAISRAIDEHNNNCPQPAVEVRMSPFEVDRLGWDNIKGLPIVGDPKISTGRFRIVCAGEKSPDGGVTDVAVVSSDREVSVDRELEPLKIR